MRDSINDAPTPKDEARLYQLGQLLNDWSADALAAHEARMTGALRGPITGFPRLDQELNGALQPGVHILHGEPGTGKTAFALQVSATCGFPALLVTCEMSPLELLKRHTARVTSTFLGRLKSGEMSPTDSMKLAREAIEQAPRLAFLDATRAYPNPQQILESARIVKGDAPHILIIIDSVHSWAEAGGAVAATFGAKEYDTLNQSLAALRGISHALGCPVLGIAERNRGSMDSGGMSASAGTRKFEYGAETVIDLQREANIMPTASGEIPIKVKFTKNRHGAAGKSTKLLFNGALQRFTEAE